MAPVAVDVFYPVPEGWGLCQACEVMLARADLGQAPPQRGFEELPPEWQADFERLSALIFGLADRYRDQILIRVHDPRSLPGLLKAIRHGVRRYPTFVVAGRTKIAGWNTEGLMQALASAGVAVG
jgi:hypothetical protein